MKRLPRPRILDGTDRRLSADGNPTVVVVGAGFGGLAAVRALRRAPVNVLVIDQHNYHLFTPLLFQLASGLLDPSEIAHPVRGILRDQANVEFRYSHVEGVDLAAKEVITSCGRLPYDYLILAGGSVSNYFGYPALQHASLPLKDFDDGLALRSHLLSRFELAVCADDPQVRKQLLTIAIIGGGPTGIEYAASLSELVRLVLRKDFPHLDLGEVDICLVEAADRILAPFDARLQRAALRMLEKRGIRVMLNAPVRSIDDGVILLGDGRTLRAGTVVWTAGVKANPLAASLGVQAGRAGRILVKETLQLPGYGEVFAVGDIAEIMAPGRALPMLAPVAIQEGRWAGHNVRQLVAGKMPQSFRYRDKGIMATVGRNEALAQIGPLRVHGFFGWLLWLTVHFAYVISFRSRAMVLLNWATDYFFYDRPVRLVTGAEATACRIPGRSQVTVGAIGE